MNKSPEPICKHLWAEHEKRFGYIVCVKCGAERKVFPKTETKTFQYHPEK